ncbi:B12-binding domain-containing radical SAM protein [Gilvibacter sediminis]|uniref:B12-binding domain-containing radical SAM protein n=1 Tax=Gilvibacter sediminis TaxID=379071 RepID=UPI0023510646|nr:radical SAM protein [Gilvibacter sediminis]MDC7996783.1 radical SAM protein [Gilvibacter sediminis]
MDSKNITLIDLNNFSYYPTISMGLVARYIRDAGFNLKVISPLSNGIKSRKREKVETKMDYYRSRIVFSQSTAVRSMIQQAEKLPYIKERFLKKRKLATSVIAAIPEDTDLVLISTYTENYTICKRVVAHLKQLNIPVIIGGPAFNDLNHVKQFVDIPGVDYVVGSEIDAYLGLLLQDFFAGNDLFKYPGVYTQEEHSKVNEYIFKKMEELPVPDYSDFPWDKYPNRIIPYMTARGCSWGKCNFCTDVVLVNGRTYRSQSKEKVLADLQALSDQVGTNIFAFTDLKLNSNVEVWNALIDGLPKIVENPIWFCAVHVDNRKRNGLDRETLKRAKKAGLTRISFGLETASQRLLDDMQKGTTVARLDQFVNDVKDAGISLRATMFIGYRDETAEDLQETFAFLTKNQDCFERIKLCRFQIYDMTPIKAELSEEERANLHARQINHQYLNNDYLKAKKDILKIVNSINSKRLNEDARAFDGVM